MRHKHKKIANGPISDDALCKVAKNYCAHLARRMRKNRIDDTLPNDGRLGFNIPKVVAACTSKFPPYFVCSARNNNTLQNPHPTLQAAYPPLRANGRPVNQTLPEVDYYPAGHCAEPHAAHILLNNMDALGHPIAIRDIRFSLAYKVKNQIVVPYCGTCRMTFPQLR